MQALFSKRNVVFFFGSIFLVYFFGMFIDVMDIDSAQYASLAREMLDSKSFLQIKLRLVDYLDKPPLTFWLASLSFYFFGYSNFAYKLPSVLFSILAIYSTYRFAKIYYSKDTSILASLILATTQAFFLINNDCRTDTNLIGCIAFTSWHLAGYLKNRNAVNFIFAFVGIGFAMLSKGPLGLMVPVLGFGIDLLLKKDFKNIFQWQWLLGLLIIAIILSPMCYGLYTQFGINGLKFYFWDQSFGRITGSNSTWKNNPDPIFLLHSFAWSFLPWPLFFFAALYHKLKSLGQQKFKVLENQEFITVSSIVLSYFILSRSQYQLPHYIYGIFPFAAVLTAAYITNVVESSQKISKVFFTLQTMVSSILIIIVGLLAFISFEATLFYYLFFVGVVLVLVFLVFAHQLSTMQKLIVMSSISIIAVNFLLNSHVYPSILKYQPSRAIASFLQSKNVDNDHFIIFQDHYSHSLDFYFKAITKEVNDVSYFESLNKGEKYFIYTNAEGLITLSENKVNFIEEKTFDSYAVTKLSLPFLNPNSREKVLSKKYLISIVK